MPDKLRLNIKELMKPIIQIDDLCKRYNIKKRHIKTTFGEEISSLFNFNNSKNNEWFYALKDVSLSINNGESLGIIGPNGAGKTTLLKLLSGVSNPTKGKITLRGSVTSILEIGSGFHPELTGRENIYLNGALQGLSRSDLKNKFDEIVDFSGIERFLETPLKHYSSGMQVRLGFSIISHLQSDILITDEVLAVGDVDFQKKSIQKMQESFKQGRTILFVSHQRNLISSLTNRCIILENGRILADGPTDNVIDNYFSTKINPKSFYESSSSDMDFKYAKLRQAGIIDLNNNLIDSEIDIRESYKIFMDVEVKHNPGFKMHAILQIKTQESYLAFISEYDIEENINTSSNSFKLECKIPENLLNVGQYFVNLSLVTYIPNKIELFANEKCLSFVIKEKIIKDHFYGDYTGWIRPKLEWKYIKK